MNSFDDLLTSPQSATGDPPALGAANATKWLPIRTLGPSHRARILRHLLALNESDRYLRFGHPASDEQIGRYVDSLDFDRDEVFGIFNRRLELVGMAHLAYMGDGDSVSRSAELGVSVSSHLRARGFGHRLFERAVLHARNRGIDTLLVHALSENTAMLRIAQRAGAHIERSGPESQAWLKLPPENLASHVEAMVEDQAAAIDYGLKCQAQFVGEMFGGSPQRPAGRERSDEPTAD